MQETWVRSLSWEDPLEEDMATLSIILAREIPWTEDPWRTIVYGSQKGGRNLATKQQHITPTFKLTVWLQSQDFNKWCIQAFPAKAVRGCNRRQVPAKGQTWGLQWEVAASKGGRKQL